MLFFYFRTFQNAHINSFKPVKLKETRGNSRERWGLKGSTRIVKEIEKQEARIQVQAKNSAKGAKKLRKGDKNSGKGAKNSAKGAKKVSKSGKSQEKG